MERVGVAFTGGLNSFAALIDARIKGHHPIPYFVNHKDMNRGEYNMLFNAEHFDGDTLGDVLKVDVQEFDMGRCWINHTLRDHNIYNYMLTPTALLREHYSLETVYVGLDDPYLNTMPGIEPSPIANTTNDFKRDLIVRELGTQLFDKWISYQVDHFADDYLWKDYHTLEELQSWHTTAPGTHS